MLPSGNDAAVLLATEFGRWLYMIGDKQKKEIMPTLNTKKQLGNFGNNPQETQEAI
jgi:hypothetical protein